MTAPTDCDPWWAEPDPDSDPPDLRLHDLRGQGLTAIQLHTIQDVEPAKEYL